jgi:hypothetical protein
MVDFNDRRLTESQKTGYVRPDIQKAVEEHLAQGSARRVTLSFNDPSEQGQRYTRSGYLRADESGSAALYPNARSTKGRSVDVANLASISSSRRDQPFINEEGKRDGKVPTTYWSRWSGPYSLPEHAR